MKKRKRRSIEHLVDLVTWKGPKGRWRQGMSYRQQRLIELLADPRDLRTKREKSRAASYNPGEVYRLQRRPEFRIALFKCAAEHLQKDKKLSDIFGDTVGRAQWGLDHHGARASELILELVRADAEARAETE